MAATQKKQMHLLATADGVAPEKVRRPIAASQGIFMPGAPCFVDGTTGQVTLADTCDGTGDVFHGFITGLSDKTVTWPLAAELSANAEVEVELIDVNDYYAVYVEAGGTDAAAPQTLVGDSYGLNVATTPAGVIGYTTMNTSNSNTAVIVVDVMANRNAIKFDTTTAPGVAIVKFLTANVNVTKAS